MVGFAKLPLRWYRQQDVCHLATQLLGKLLVTRLAGNVTVGRIVETEAYAGITDQASHAFGGRFTPRTQVMYAAGGVAYVYLCYGLHQMFNVVTHAKGVPHAVLVRALEPLAGIEIMLQRRGKARMDYTLTRGPGALAQAMGINTRMSGVSLRSSQLFVADDGCAYPEEQIVKTPRIGVDYAGEHAAWPYRFHVKNCPWVSKMPSKKSKDGANNCNASCTLGVL